MKNGSIFNPTTRAPRISGFWAATNVTALEPGLKGQLGGEQ